MSSFPTVRLLKVLAFAAAFALAGCGASGSKKNTEKAPKSDVPAFSDVNAVLEAKCAPCHVDGSRHSNLVGHQDKVDAFAADIESRITSTDPKVKMPLDLGTVPLTQEEKDTFNAVLGKNTGKASTYADLAPIIERSCARCHGEKSRSLKFAGDESAVRAVADEILDEVNEGAMPPLSKVLSDSERDLLVRYLDSVK